MVAAPICRLPADSPAIGRCWRERRAPAGALGREKCGRVCASTRLSGAERCGLARLKDDGFHGLRASQSCDRPCRRPWADPRTFRSNFSGLGRVRAGPQSGMIPLHTFRTSGQIARCAIGRPRSGGLGLAHKVLLAQSQGHVRLKPTAVVHQAPGCDPDQHSCFASKTPFGCNGGWRVGGPLAKPHASAPLETTLRRCGRARRAVRRGVPVIPVVLLV